MSCSSELSEPDFTSWTLNDSLLDLSSSTVNWRAIPRAESTPAKRVFHEHGSYNNEKKARLTCLTNSAPPFPSDHRVLELLETLSQKQPLEIVSTVLSPDFSFDSIFEQIYLNPPYLFPLLRMIRVVCSSKLPHVTKLLEQVCKLPLVDCIQAFLKKLSVEVNLNSKTFDAFIDDLTEFYSTVVVKLPEIATELDFKKLILQTTYTINFMSEFYPPTETSSDSICSKLDELSKNLESSFKSNALSLSTTSDVVDDFRTIRIFPSSEEEIEYPQFVIKGAYENVNHYLSTHFKSLRANFTYLVYLIVKKYQNQELEADSPYHVTVCSRVRFIHLFPWKKTIIYCVNLESPVHGSLVCGTLVVFSKNYFRSVLYAAVLDYKADKNRIYLSILEEENSEELFDSTYSMAFTDFCLMRHNYPCTMKSLISLNHDNFPMRSYFVDAEVRTQSPTYVAQMNSVSYLRSAIMMRAANPPKELPIEVQFDQYQLSAITSMLSQNVTLVQGASGTGKTFLAMALIQILLKEMNILRVKENNVVTGVTPAPIMIICRSNRVLDEYIHRLSQHTEKLVRIGGKTLYPWISRFNLREACRSDTCNYSVNQLKSEVLQLQRELHGLGSKMKEVNEFRGIISYDALQNVMSSQHRRQLANWKMISFLMDEEDPRFTNGDLEADDNRSLDLAYLNELSLKNNLLSELVAIASEQAVSDISENPLADEIFHDFDFDLARNCTSQDSVTILECTLLEYVSRYDSRVKQMESMFDKCRRGVRIDRRELYYIIEDVQISRRKMDYLYRQLIFIKNGFEAPEKFELLQNEDIRRVKAEDRWELYRWWVGKLRSTLFAELRQKVIEYRTKMGKYVCAKDMDVLSKALVIGITSACATRFRNYLTFLNPAIVIVEESTQIMEAELITCLSNQCQHLVLFGDMKSTAPPNPPLYAHRRTESLFERLINNGMNYYWLRVQRCMKPEISSLLKPFYSELINHWSIEQCGRINGFAKNVFFMSHEFSDMTCEEVKSKRNTFEAEFVLKICEHLLCQAYKTTEISILTFHEGQMNCLREIQKHTPNPLLKHIEITTVDEYQNRKNLVILLSFACSYGEDDMNHPNYEIRLCSALSRAKEGLFMLGNMTSLTKYSEIWKKIKDTLLHMNAIESKIPVHCKRHQKILSISTIDNNYWNGCGETCNANLNCGHICKSMCHFGVAHQSTKYTCTEKCIRKCDIGHPCPVLCSDKCPPCQAAVTVIGYCGHVVKKKCGAASRDVECSQPCNEILPCGHKCLQNCHLASDKGHKKYKCPEICGKVHEECTKGHLCAKYCWERCSICLVMELNTLQCGHQVVLPCSTDLSKVRCLQNCAKNCPNCGIPCKKYCYERCDPCCNMVQKKVESCGHEIVIECGIPAEIQWCKTYVKTNYLTTPCGHNSLYLPCSMLQNDPESLLPYCDTPCNQILRCGHKCTGTCGKCFQGRFHKLCEKECEKIHVCGHKCSALCDDFCPACDRKCENFCKHIKCQMECGLTCTPCKAKCEWKCKHQICTRTCGELCDRSPCYEPCDVVLKCGHVCIGYCGEPCPTVCRYCDEITVSTIFPGSENDPNVRFVLLEDCNHVVEAKTLDSYMMYNDSEMVIKRCPFPFCQKPITTTLRYRNYVKLTYQRVKQLKKEHFGVDEQMCMLIRDILNKLKNITELRYFCVDIFPNVTMQSLDLELELIELENSIRSIVSSEDAHFSQPRLRKVNFCLDLIDEMISRVVDLKFGSTHTKQAIEERAYVAKELLNCLTIIALGIKQSLAKMNSQVVEDLKCEINRFHRLIDYYIFSKSTKYDNIAGGGFLDSQPIRPSLKMILSDRNKFTEEHNKRAHHRLLILHHKHFSTSR